MFLMKFSSFNTEIYFILIFRRPATEKAAGNNTVTLKTNSLYSRIDRGGLNLIWYRLLMFYRTTLENSCGSPLGGGGGGYSRAQNAAILPLRRQRQHRLQDGVHQRSHEGPHISVHQRVTAVFLQSLGERGNSNQRKG